MVVHTLSSLVLLGAWTCSPAAALRAPAIRSTWRGVSPRMAILPGPRVGSTRNELLQKLSDLQQLDQNGDGVVSVKEAESTLFGPVTLLDEIVRTRTYIIIALVPVVGVLAYLALPELVDALSVTALRRVSPQTRALSTTVLTSVLLPTNSLLFGTLVSTTISRQWERQRRLREELNTELQVLEDLTTVFRHLLGDAPARLAVALFEIRGYLISLLCECSWRCPDVDRQLLSEDQREHSRKLHSLIFTSVDRKLVERAKLPDLIINTATAGTNLIVQLDCVRARRRSSRETEFPVLHWVLVFVLGCSVIFAFLTECAGALDESFGEALKIRVAFSFMCSFLVALTGLLTDLSDPFTGEYQVDVVISGPVRVLQDNLRFAVEQRRLAMAAGLERTADKLELAESRVVATRARTARALQWVVDRLRPNFAALPGGSNTTSMTAPGRPAAGSSPTPSQATSWWSELYGPDKAGAKPPPQWRG